MPDVRMRSIDGIARASFLPIRPAAAAGAALPRHTTGGVTEHVGHAARVSPPCYRAIPDSLPNGLGVGGNRREIGREAQERLTGLPEDRLELAVLDLQPRKAAGSRLVGLRPVDGGDESIGVVVRHLVDGVDDLLAREVASPGLQASDEQI